MIYETRNAIIRFFHNVQVVAVITVIVSMVLAAREPREAKIMFVIHAASTRYVKWVYSVLGYKRPAFIGIAKSNYCQIGDVRSA